MVKQNRYELAKRFRAKLILSDRSIAGFCRQAGVSYALYRNYIRGIVKGTRAGDTKIKRLVAAMEEFMADDSKTDKSDSKRRAA